MSFAAFAEGFFTTASENIGRRTERAENYFEQQMERARTTGMNQLSQRRQRRDQIEGLAVQLRENAQMPEDIVRALVSEGPEALQSAVRIYSDSAQGGVPLSEEFWRSAYPMVQQMAVDTDTPFTELLDRTTGLYPNNLEATLETGGDPFSAFVSSALGLNAMDRARSRLQREQVASGFSAADLLALESRPQHERAFSTTGLGPNLQNIAAARAEVGTPLTQAQIRTYTNDFNRTLDQAVSDYVTRERQQGRDASPEDARAILAPIVASEFAAMSGLSDAQLQRIPVLARFLPQEAAIPAQEDFPAEINDAGTVLTLVGMTEDGRGIYQTPDGRRAPPIPLESARNAAGVLATPSTEVVPEDTFEPDIPFDQRAIPTPSLMSRQEGGEEEPQEPEVTYEEWQRMTRAERRRAGLPVSELGAQRYFRRFRAGMAPLFQN